MRKYHKMHFNVFYGIINLSNLVYKHIKIYKYINELYTIKYIGTKIFIADYLYIFIHIFMKNHASRQ